MDTKELLKQAQAKLAEARKARLKGALQAGSTRGPVGKKKVPELLTKALRRWGAKSLDELMKVNTSDKKYAYVPLEEREQIRSLKEAVDVAIIISKYFEKPVKETQFYQQDLQFHLKAFGIDSGDEGFEWIPTMVAESYIDEFNLDRKVSSLFTDIRMPSNPYKWPVLTNGAIARKVAAVTSLSPSQVFNTDKTITFDAIKMTAQYELPEELNEDAAPDVVRVIRQEVIEGQEKAMEIAMLEGATAADLHHFTQLPDESPTTTIASISAATPETAFDGMRDRALAAGAAATVDASNASVTETELSAARANMGKFGVNPKDLALITGPKVYNQLLQLDDVRTIEQYGGQATVLTGELARYEGMPVIVSEYLREDLTALGKNEDSGSNDRGSVLMVNRKRWYTGTRRAIRVLVEKNRTQFDVLDMVSFARRAFEAVLDVDGGNYATESSVSLVINIAL